jgi:hypothetical protein
MRNIELLVGAGSAAEAVARVNGTRDDDDRSALRHGAGERQILMPGDARIGLAGTSTRALLF